MDSLEQLHHILVIEDPSFKREINLDAATYSLGRHSSNDIVLSCQKTSRNHATLLRRTDLKTNKCSYWILDGDLQGNRSRNGIYINGKKSLVHELKSGDNIQFSGDAQAIYKASKETPKPFSSPGQNDLELEPSSARKSVNKETVVTPPQNSIVGSNTKTVLVSSPQQTSLTELSPQPIIEIDLYGNILYINSAGIINFKDIYHQKLSHPLLKNLIAQYHQGHDNIISREVTVGERIFQQTAHYLPDKRVIINYITDVSQQKKLELQLQHKSTLYENILAQITDGVIIAESSTKQIIEVNPVSSDLLGYDATRLLQMNIYELAHESKHFASIVQRVIVEKQDFNGEILLQNEDGRVINTQVKIDLINFDNQEKICLIIQGSDQSNSVQSNIFQPITDLSQREIFNQQIVTAIANATRSKKLMAIMFCQLDSLANVQSSIGIDKIDQLLSTLKQRLNSCLRAGDTVIHWQGQKFALLLPQISGVEEVAKINQRIQKLIRESFQIGETKITTNINTGIAIFPQDGSDGEILLASANTALERTLKSNDSYQFYDENINSQVIVTLELENLLQQGLDKQEFELYYQPQIDINTGKLEAVEALLRWQHPDLGLVTPSNFIKSAEKSKLIVPIGEWSIQQACRQNKAWQAQGLPTTKVTVSLSAVQFQQPNLIQKIADILAETTLEPQLLELEISAVSLLENIEYSRNILTQLKSTGVHIAVDSFTSGFSTLEYLKQLPLDTLKIDRSLVHQLTDNSQDLAVIAALIELGEGFDLRIVAEGVENQEQVDLLKQLNCKQMQGFWFGRPMAADEASKLLQLNHPEDLSITDDSEHKVEVEDLIKAADQELIEEVDQDWQSDLNEV